MGEDFTDRRLARTPIAIVGMSGLFPKARNHREYWQNVVAGIDCTEDVPDSRWRTADYYDPDPTAPDKSYARRGAFLPDVEFDPLEFGLPPNQLEITSMQQVLSLGLARDLLRDAGAPDSAWYDPLRTGVVLGVTGRPPLAHGLTARLTTPVLKEVVRSCGLSARDAEEIAEKYVTAFPPFQENSFPGYLPNVIAGRVANRLGLGGMNCTVDAACAASLAAVRLAVSELVDGRADMMITGGVDTENSIFEYVSFAKVGALSHSDRISPFSAAADGTLLGEGIGMIGLRRLADAERDGNTVYAVIRGIGSSSDGRANSIYAPRAEGQRVALDRAYADAECSPASVGLFEAHATGTVAGDRTELTTLDGLLRGASDERGFAALGSVKSQIGHTKAAAGTASLMKAALALREKVLPGTINVDEPNGSVEFTDAPFYVNTRTRPWVLDPARPARRAAVSAMGFGGTNFHFVLEEHRPERTGQRVLHRTPTARLWHAPDRETLLDLVRGDAPAGDGGADIPAAHARIGFVALDDEHASALRELAVRELTDAEDVEEWSHPRGVFYRRHAAPDVRVGALFAGQGSQYVDMGLTAVLNNPVVGAAFDAANASFADAGPRLGQVVFPPPAFDAETRGRQEATLRRTQYAQPAIGALSAGQFGVLRELGLVCAGYAGHSFGELTALWASGALGDADFHRIAAARGAAMMPREGHDPGTMAAVFATREEVTELLVEFPGVVVCNHNSPGQVVVGGGTEEVERLLAECRDRRTRAVRLPVAAAFHTEYIAHALDTFGPQALATTITEPAAPVYANSPGAEYGADPEANARTLIQQLRRPVEFVSALQRMRDDGITVFVEFGPQQQLSQLVTQTLGDGVRVIPTDAGPRGDSDLMLKRAAVRLAVLGLPLTGINRYAEPLPEPTVAKGPTVSLSAPEYTPPERRAAYEAALTDGYRVPSATAAPTPTPTLLAPPTADVKDDMPEALDQYLSLHAQYLESQSRVTAQIAEALGRPMDAHLAGAVTAAARQSEAVGQAHGRAGEVLAKLAELRSGPPGAAPALTPPAAGDGTLDAITFEPAPAPAPLPDPLLIGAGAETYVQNGLPHPPEPAEAPPAAPAQEHPVTGDDVRTQLIEVIAEKTGYPTSMLDPSMDLETDLGVDSIKRVQVLSALRKRMPQLPSVELERLGELRTADQIAAYLSEAGDAAPKAREAGAGTRRYLVELVALPAPDVLDGAYRADPVAIVVGGERTGGDPTDADALADGLTARGWTVRRVPPGAEPAGPVTDDVDLWLCLLGAEPEWDAARRRLAGTVLLAKQAALTLPARAHRTGFVTVTRLDGGLGLHGRRGPVASLVGGIGGAVKTLAQERPGLFCRALDIDPGLPRADFVTTVLDEIQDAALDTVEVGVDATGTRRTVAPGPHGPARRVSEVGGAPLDELTPTDQDVLLVTGGARAVTARCVRALADATAARFVLLGRTEPGTEPEWAAGVADARLKDAAIAALSADGVRRSPREIDRICADLLARREVGQTLAALGDRADYVRADVTDAASVAAALAGHRARVTGVVHGAGALADALLPDKTADQIEHVLRVKLDGLRNVLDALDPSALRHLVLFTSVAGLLGNPGQADYAVANEALCRFAAGWKHEHPAAHVTAIDWGAWRGGMVTPDLADLFAERGVPLLDPEAGTRAFVEQFTRPHRSDVRVLIGESRTLGGTRVGPPAAFTARRDITAVAADPVLRAHTIGAHPVLPSTFGLGWLVNVVERANPGLYVTGARDFQVHKGIVFDGSAPGAHRIVVEPGAGEGAQSTVRAAVSGANADGRPVPHYAVTLVLATEPAPAPVIDVPPVVDGPEDALEWYRDATMFHGPPLQGLRQVLERTSTRLTLRCRLADADVSGRAFHGLLHGPVLADLLLQALGVLGGELLGRPCLPLGIGRAEWFAPLPDDEPFLIVAEAADGAGAGDQFTGTATATTLDGRVLQRFADADFVATAGMAGKFRRSVRGRQDAADAVTVPETRGRNGRSAQGAQPADVPTGARGKGARS
ncbi:SDR family NAD(P)-dependent oxidoreductase [Streptomyces sp. NPDC059894]|uniref:SDR family NAD(P)-dependent oxidoreductase n=1 Tax=unclassified Streptomyces TaxID=2593676 RepID=UPI00364EE749